VVQIATTLQTMNVTTMSSGCRQPSRLHHGVRKPMKPACREPMIRREAMLVLIATAGGPGGRAGIVQNTP
jgi:hypothetical protein